MTESQHLLAEYVQNGSETAFRELVERYINLVFSTALRMVQNDAQAAEDVTQTVFLDLSRHARELSREALLGGWLHRDTCYVARKAMRQERRRQARERQAALMNSQPDHSEANLERVAPILDEAINLLGTKDRAAILLRFFEQRDFRSVAVALGTNEDAARMRVSRALEKLHLLLERRGVRLSAVALATALGAEAVTAAPVGLAGSVAGTVLATSTASGTIAATLVKILVMTKLKAGLLGAVALAGVTTSWVIYQQAQARQHEQAQSLRQQADQLAQLAADNQRLSELVAQANGATNRLQELPKLRAEATSLRARSNDLAQLREENRRIQETRKAASPVKTPLQEREQAIAKMTFSKALMLAFHQYATSNQDQFPINFDQAVRFLPDELKAETNLTTAQYEVVFQGTWRALTNPATVIVLREKEASPTLGGKWAKSYAFADGHSEYHVSEDGDFEHWENQHLAPPPAK